MISIAGGGTRVFNVEYLGMLSVLLLRKVLPHTTLVHDHSLSERGLELSRFDSGDRLESDRSNPDFYEIHVPLIVGRESPSSNSPTDGFIDQETFSDCDDSYGLLDMSYIEIMSRFICSNLFKFSAICASRCFLR